MVLGLKAGIWATRLEFEPQAKRFELMYRSQGWDLSSQARIWISRLGFGLKVWIGWGLKAGIWVFGPGFGPKGWVLSLKAEFWVSRLEFGPQDWDLGLKAGIWASRLGFEP